MSTTIPRDPATVAEPPAEPPTERSDSTLYKIFWRWHFYAGVFAIPVLVLLCISGLIYLFRPQLEALQYGGAMKVEQGTSVVSYQDQVDAALAKYPGASVFELGTPHTATDATTVSLNTTDGKSLTVFVDPYSGEVTGTRDNGADLSNLALELHGTLLFGRVPFLSGPDDDPGKYGDRIIELAASWTVVLLATGTYLFWPRRRRDGTRGWRQAFRIRRGVANKRLAWRDVHAVTGVLFSFVTLFFLITGLMWSGLWGVKYGEVLTKAGTSYPEGIWDGATSQTGDDLQRTAKGGWISNNLPLFPSGITPQIDPADVKPGYVPDQAADGSDPHAGHHADGEQPADGSEQSVQTGEGALSWDPTQGAPIDAVVASALEAGIPSGFPISYPGDATGSYAIWLSADGSPFVQRGAQGERQMYIDQNTAEVLRDFKFEEFGVGARASDLGIVLHEGRQFGFWNQMLTMVATLALLLSIASSVVMWFKRRPKRANAMAAPRRTSFATRGQAIGVVVIAVALGVFFPLLGLSMIALLVVDTVLIRFVPPMRRLFG
ncbi:MAG: PepSY domain-containing protein [Nocardioides sp.]